MLSAPITGNIEPQKGDTDLKIAIKKSPIFVLPDLHRSNSYHFSANEND